MATAITVVPLDPAAHAATHASDGSDAITLAQSQVTGLVSALAGKADVNHTQAAATITGLGTAATRDVGTGAGTVCAGDDSRLSNARAPTAHASSHASTGSDPITPASIGAAAASHTQAASTISDSTAAGRTLLTAADAAAQRSALGLGDAATKNVGTASGSVCAGDDSRLSDARTPTSHTQAASTISDSTAAGRALLTAADAAAQRSALGLGTAALVNTGTSSGNVPVLDGSGKLNSSVIPAGGSSSITASTATDLTGFLRGNGSLVSGSAFALSDLPAGTLDHQQPLWIDGAWSQQTIDQTNYVVNPQLRIQQQTATSFSHAAFCYDEWSLLAEVSSTWAADVMATETGTNRFARSSTFGRLRRITGSSERVGLVQIIPAEITRTLWGQSVRCTARVRFDTAFNGTENVTLTLLGWSGAANASGSRTVTTNLNPWTWASVSHSVLATQTLAVTGSSSVVFSISANNLASTVNNLVLVVSVQSPTTTWGASGLCVSQVMLNNVNTRQRWQTPHPSLEEAQCYRRFYRLRDGSNQFLGTAEKLNNRFGSGDALLFVSLPVPMASAPTVTVSSNSHIVIRGDDYNVATSPAFQATRIDAANSDGALYFTCNGNALWWGLSSSTAFIDFSARI